MANLTGVEEIPGYGVQGYFGGRLVKLGRAEWVGADAIDETATYLRLWEMEPITFAFQDALRDGAFELLKDIQHQVGDVHILSGDSEQAVAAIAARLQVINYAANEKPQGKAAYIAALQAQGKNVLMIGDGLNDTAALTAANVSISPASALDAARVASDVVFLGGRLDNLIGVVGLARQSQRRIKENFRIASFYNVIAVPIAMLGLATPFIAALAMSLSSITVTLNALRVR